MLGGMALTVNPPGLDVGLHRNSSTRCSRYVEQQISQEAESAVEAVGAASIAQKTDRGGEEMIVVCVLACSRLYIGKRNSCCKRAVAN